MPYMDKEGNLVLEVMAADSDALKAALHDTKMIGFELEPVSVQ